MDQKRKIHLGAIFRLPRRRGPEAPETISRGRVAVGDLRGPRDAGHWVSSPALSRQRRAARRGFQSADQALDGGHAGRTSRNSLTAEPVMGAPLVACGVWGERNRRIPDIVLIIDLRCEGIGGDEFTAGA